ncbi:MAG: hypothetical protein A2934_05320 [Candidatus Sungbacteria bacterium RIFCSPLOWO2_01_FULL_47_10]|uniref:Uncharacterized protein n=1 Tax=Candidatus Sungbacteria bacterium RIFCSPLOWO2_01_FULL_47_10 TaxID=1802276 RepID=A0A1G2L0I3_9BACT|nr:MAG: hypothetical protein A2934_05320 [Candidatus Sungbacteria bacterium RIFCSPLOWO2_01_FULL_47_10]
MKENIPNYPEGQNVKSIEHETKYYPRFKEVYESNEWKSLNSIDRAQLLLVAEGIKPGTYIGGDFTHFQKIVEKLGLDFSFNSDPRRLKPVYTVATREAHNELQRKYLTLPERIPRGTYWKIDGEFLGYPECDIEEYSNPQKNIEKRDIKDVPGGRKKRISNFEYECGRLTNYEDYPEEMHYRPPAYTPCGVRCEKARAMLKKYKEVLEASDPEAAKGLRKFNLRSELKNLSHSMTEEQRAQMIEELKIER